MKAVVMAGGEGTRLRPLTSNQPKPMVPIVGKPCMEHILELLKDHGPEEVIITLAFLPQAIRGYFGTEVARHEIEYSVEETPLETASSVRLASDRLDDAFLVISGDALCDFDLSALVDFHKQKGAAVTIGLKSVENPLEFGIVVTDEDGQIERFLEAHRGARSSPTRSTPASTCSSRKCSSTSPTTARSTSPRNISPSCLRWAARSTAT